MAISVVFVASVPGIFLPSYFTGHQFLFATYSVGLVFAKDDLKLTDRLIHDRELFRIQVCSLTHQACAAKWQILLIRFGQFALGLEGPIQVLPDGTMSTISSDQDISFMDGIVGCLDDNFVTLVRDDVDSLAEMEFLGRDQAEDEVVQLRACYDVISVTCTVVEEEIGGQKQQRGEKTSECESFWRVAITILTINMISKGTANCTYNSSTRL